MHIDTFMWPAALQSTLPRYFYALLPRVQILSNNHKTSVELERALMELGIFWTIVYSLSISFPAPHCNGTSTPFSINKYKSLIFKIIGPWTVSPKPADKTPDLV